MKSKEGFNSKSIKRRRNFSCDPSNGRTPLIGCQRVTINYERLYREDHPYDLNYQQRLLERLEECQARQNAMNKRNEVLESKFKKLLIENEKVVKFQQKALGKLKTVHKSNGQLKQYCEDFKQLQPVLQGQTKGLRGTKAQETKAFYETKISELRSLYRSAFLRSTDKISPRKSESRPQTASKENAQLYSKTLAAESMKKYLDSLGRFDSAKVNTSPYALLNTMTSAKLSGKNLNRSSFLSQQTRPTATRFQEIRIN